VARVLREFARSRPDDRFVESLGTRGYFGLMRHAAAMVGNSSSGLVEAPSFRLPVVNVGIRQEGRLRARNVIDVPCERGAILRALRRATHPRFRASLAGLRNPYQASRPAAEIIVRTLKGVPLGEKLLLKRFVDR
jgi:UDP-N-acetylglucosamine 2-epimerase